MRRSGGWPKIICALTLSTLQDAVRNALCYHTGAAAWAGARKSVLKWEDEYWTRSEKEEMIDSDDDDDKMGVSKDSEMMS